jgi:ribosomal protein S18 acetylase RimI-like enzyme
MTPEEFRVATERREAESVRVLSRLMPEQLARERVRRGTETLLPDGLGTAGHHLLTAQNAAGEAVGNAWVGPDLSQVVGTADAAWLYDIYVFPPFRRLGYGAAVLAAIETLMADEGRSSLGLNVVGDNEAAIALYRGTGYEVASMSMRKRIERQD